MRKLSARWVPRFLTMERKKRSEGVAEFLRQLLTVDETWIHNLTPQTKDQFLLASRENQSYPFVKQSTRVSDNMTPSNKRHRENELLPIVTELISNQVARCLVALSHLKGTKRFCIIWRTL